MTKECGNSARTFKSALIWCVPEKSDTIYEEARKLLAWNDIQDEVHDLKLDDAQKSQITTNSRSLNVTLKNQSGELTTKL